MIKNIQDIEKVQFIERNGRLEVYVKTHFEFCGLRGRERIINVGRICLNRNGNFVFRGYYANASFCLETMRDIIIKMEELSY